MKIYWCKCSINPILKIFDLIFHSLFAIKYPKMQFLYPHRDYQIIEKISIKKPVIKNQNLVWKRKLVCSAMLVAISSNFSFIIKKQVSQAQYCSLYWIPQSMGINYWQRYEFLWRKKDALRKRIPYNFVKSV